MLTASSMYTLKSEMKWMYIFISKDYEDENFYFVNTHFRFPFIDLLSLTIFPYFTYLGTVLSFVFFYFSRISEYSSIFSLDIRQCIDVCMLGFPIMSLLAWLFRRNVNELEEERFHIVYEVLEKQLKKDGLLP